MKITKEKVKYFFRLPTKEFMIRISKKYFIILIITSFLISMVVINLQPSIPVGIYIKYFNKNYKKGDVIVIDLEKKYHKYFNRTGKLKYIAKKIIADEKDKIEIIDNEIYVNNMNYGVINDLGLPYPNVKIDKNCFYVLSMQKGSFDSRYFGQVCEDKIKYKIIPFIIF